MLSISYSKRRARQLRILIPGLLFVVTLNFSVWAQEKIGAHSSNAPIATLGSDREQDGLTGPVRTLRTEAAKLSVKSNTQVEEPRVLLATSTYDPQGTRIDSAYYPVAGASVAGKEEYKYDNKGNIKEMMVRQEDGTILSVELYDYEFDMVGNWTKMVTRVAVIEGGKMRFEPTQVTYRAITYFDKGNAKISQPALVAVLNKDLSATTSNTGTTTPATVGSKKADAGPSVKGVDRVSSSSTLKQTTQPISNGTLNNKAIRLPKSVYPDIATLLRASGMMGVPDAASQVSLATSITIPLAPPPSASSQAPPAETNAAIATIPLTDIYRVGVGDILDIRLLNQATRESTLYTVMAGGLLEYPLAGEPLIVAGMTTDEISMRLAPELKRRAVHENPRVMVSVREFVSHTVLVSGLVEQPGAKVLRREAVPLFVLLAGALPRAEAGNATITSRATGQNTTVDLSDQVAMNTLIHPGDVIKVSVRSPEFFYIGGNINAPGQKEFHSGLTLTQAMLASGGVVRPANRSVKVKLSRQGQDGRLSTTEYNLEEIESGKVPDPRLQPGDRVKVEQER